MYNVTHRNTAKQTVVHRVYVRVYVKCAGNKGTQYRDLDKESIETGFLMDTHPLVTPAMVRVQHYTFLEV